MPLYKLVATVACAFPFPLTTTQLRSMPDSSSSLPPSSPRPFDELLAHSAAHPVRKVRRDTLYALLPLRFANKSKSKPTTRNKNMSINYIPFPELIIIRFMSLSSAVLEAQTGYSKASPNSRKPLALSASTRSPMQPRMRLPLRLSWPYGSYRRIPNS
ncbi:hypothetical protein FB451DRAFT_673133 [Mycena latifolia]|nr:hypothetical protein FB451DRAFT_673133 [Mycena latifolia]